MLSMRRTHGLPDAPDTSAASGAATNLSEFDGGTAPQGAGLT
jgi:hypothetical protein